jgi:hypothetical protein
MSLPTALPTTLPIAFPAAILETVLSGLAALFLAGANGDIAAARQAASQMLDAYHPRTEDEFRLAANIIGFSFQALEALGQAAAPDLPLTRAMRLRGSAVSLSREAARAERRLAQLRKQAAAAEIGAAASPKIEQASPPLPLAPIPPVSIKTPGKIARAAEAKGITWTQAYAERQCAARIAASIKRAEDRVAAQSPAIVSDRQPMAAAS